MQNTYQDLITEIQNKNPGISPKLEGGKKFQMKTDFKPAGDQPEAIKQLVNGANKDQLSQVLLGVTGSGKTFTMAKVIEKTNSFFCVVCQQLKVCFVICNKRFEFRLYLEEDAFLSF